MAMSASDDPVYMGLDQKFDKVLADMKPHVLKLPHKTDRQKCAIWIKKLCEPMMGITGRKNRNAYAQLMLHMLKRGVLEGPFTSKPQEGPLPTLPPYMSIYFDESTSNKKTPQDDKVPDWVAGELTSSIGSSLFKSTIGVPAASSTWKGISPIVPDRSLRRRAHTSMGVELDKDPGLSSPMAGLGLDQPDHVPLAYGTDDELSQPSPPYNGPTSALFGTTSNSTRLTFDNNDTRDVGRDVKLKTEMLEARFHEEKLRLQQKHDGAVQKILDRKNAEIEDLKSHYRTKAKELEDTISKMEKKMQTLVKDSQYMRETKDKQIQDLKHMVEDVTVTKKNEFEKQLNDLMSEFETEKFEMQKQHTKNIQEILDDTNGRLMKMEKEYCHQSTSTTSVIKELESRLHKLMSDADTNSKTRESLERDKMELDCKLSRITSDYQDLRERHSDLEKEHAKTLETHDQEMRTIKNKMEASIEFMKQEHNIAAAKSADSISELENHIDQLKRALKDAEEQRQRQMRELEQVQQQDKIHLENLHDKQTRAMKLEAEQMEQDFQKKIKKLEQTIREKDDEIKSLSDKNKSQTQQSEKALEDFKAQVEKNQDRMYTEMKQQMERVEADLNKSKQSRERQARDFTSQLEDERAQHEKKIVELKMSLEHEKAQMLQDFHKQKEILISEREQEIHNMKDSQQNELDDLDTRMQERIERDGKKISSLERQNQELREEIVQSNQLRKQQLVELGLLREEEKQKMQREHEAELSRMRSEMEQQRLELQKTHSTELEKMLEKTNARLKEIEKEYVERGQKATETIQELQATTSHLREEVKRVREMGERKLQEQVGKLEEEKNLNRKQYGATVESLQKDIDSQKNRVKTLQKRLEQQDVDNDEKTTHLKMSYEEKIRGLMPAAIRMELEDTITSLKSQVNTLQQKCMVLQEEVDLKSQFGLNQFSNGSPIKAV